MPFFLKCNGQKTGLNKDSNSGNMSKVVNNSWMLENLKDQYDHDSIPLEDLKKKKVLKFVNDSIAEYYYPFKKPARSMIFEIDSNSIYLKSGDQIIDQYGFQVHFDTLIIMRQGRHGTIKEYYTLFKND